MSNVIAPKTREQRQAERLARGIVFGVPTAGIPKAKDMTPEERRWWIENYICYDDSEDVKAEAEAMGRRVAALCWERLNEAFMKAMAGEP